MFSHSPHHALLPASLTYNFNVSLRKTREDIRYAYARIPKLSLEEKELEHVKEQCNGPISLQLLAKTHTNRTDNSNDVFTLLSSARLGQHAVGQSLQVEFTGFTEQFKHWQKEGSRQGDIIEMRLIIGGTVSCYDTLTPQELGFRPNTSGYIVVFSKSDDSEEAIIKAGLAELAAEATASRQRRSVGGDEVVEGGEETPTDATVDHRRPEDAENTTRLSSHDIFNASHYHLHTCRRYSHTVSRLHLHTNSIYSGTCMQALLVFQACRAYYCTHTFPEEPQRCKLYKLILFPHICRFDTAQLMCQF